MDILDWARHRATAVWRDCGNSPVWKGWERWGFQPGEEKAQEGHSVCVPERRVQRLHLSHLKGLQMDQALLSSNPGQDKKEQTQNETGCVSAQTEMLKHNLNIRKHLSSGRMTEHQHKFPREVLKSLHLEIFNIRKGKAQGHPLWLWKVFFLSSA